MTEPANLDVDARLAATVADPRRRILVRGGTVVTMDPRLGEVEACDVLIEGDRIAAVQPGLAGEIDAAAALVIDAEQMIVAPGLVDTHRHCWQTQCRRLLTSADFSEYFPTFHARLGPRFSPEDVYIGNHLAALTALETGVTCLLDYCHNSRSEAHSDAAIDGLRDAGVRAVHASAPPMAGTWDGQWPEDLHRLRRRTSAAGDGLLTLRLAVFGSAEQTRPEDALSAETIAFGRGIGVEIVADAVFGPEASGNVERLGRAGLLGPDITLIHCTDLSDEAWRMIADTGVGVSLCPTSDTLVGCGSGQPPIQEALDRAVPAGISVDIECSVPSTMFAQMQALYTIQRMNAYGARYRDPVSAPDPVSAKRTLELATASGARVNGVGDRCGTITPGKDADLLLLRVDDYATMPLNDPIGTIVLGCDTGNIAGVFVAGCAKRWGAELLGQDRLRVRRLVTESRDRVLAACERRSATVA